MHFDIEKRTILEVVHGSRAYGLAGPESDLDIRGVAIPPRNHFLGYAFVFEQYEGEKNVDGEADRVIYGIRKFFKLASDCNPNVLEFLYVPSRCIRRITPWGEKLIESRDLFLSKVAKFKFSGYAIAQLKRIQTHRRWLLNPPDHKPLRAEFGLPETALLSQDIQGAIANLEEKKVDLGVTFSAEVMTLYRRERQYHNALREWQQHENWRQTRNPKRAALEARHGYDTKHAMHLVRLMRMCREILTEGKIVVERPDREELLAIRNGSWTFDKLISWAEAQDQELSALYESCTILPKSPDVHKLDALCEDIVSDYLEKADQTPPE